MATALRLALGNEEMVWLWWFASNPVSHMRWQESDIADPVELQTAAGQPLRNVPRVALQGALCFLAHSPPDLRTPSLTNVLSHRRRLFQLLQRPISMHRRVG